MRFWVLDHVFRCLSRPIFHLLTLLSLITWNTPLVFVLKGYLFNFTRLCEFSLPLNSVLSNLHSPCLIKSRNEGESTLSGETKQRLQRWLCLKQTLWNDLKYLVLSLWYLWNGTLPWQHLKTSRYLSFLLKTEVIAFLNLNRAFVIKEYFSCEGLIKMKNDHKSNLNLFPSTFLVP